MQWVMVHRFAVEDYEFPVPELQMCNEIQWITCFLDLEESDDSLNLIRTAMLQRFKYSFEFGIQDTFKY